uniref:Trichohyalin-plectin-homology domain-containing protein n=1 Tax=Bracon brevicornis TaxID=1563983 RepID=A0A6V7LBW9_9HYME
MMAHEEDINIRRERLRDMLLREDAELMREVVNQIHNSEEAKRVQMRIAAEEKKIEEERNRRCFITNKKRQQHFENCPETRVRISRDITRGVKYSNLIQMLENEEKRQAERKLDELWYKIMLKENETQRIRDDEAKCKREMMSKETGLILEQQIAGRSSSVGQVQRLREQERLELERLWNEVRAEEVRKLAQEREKRERLRRDLEEQLMSAKRRMAEQHRQQADVERMLKVVNEEGLKKEREAIINNKESLRKEVMAYMKNLEDLREEQARREVEVNAIIEESAKDAQARRDLASKRYKEERKRNLAKFLLERDEQMRWKQQAKKEQEKFIEDEKNLLTKEAEVSAADSINETERKREAALHYGKQLLAQRQYDEERKCQEAEKDRQFHNDTLKDNKEYLKLTEELVNAPEIITPSAFRIKLEEYTARRDAAA